jgi:hypothetical protein
MKGLAASERRASNLTASAAQGKPPTPAQGISSVLAVLARVAASRERDVAPEPVDAGGKHE